MGLTLSNSNYGGEVSDKIFLELGLGNEIAKEAISTTVTDVPGKYSIPRMSSTELPIGVYTKTAPTSDTVTVTYAERELNMTEATVYFEFVPSEWHGTIWKKWQAAGDFTNLEMNTQLMSAILDLVLNKAGAQYSKLAFQGDTSLAASTKLHFIDGWVTRAKADANVIKPDPIGDINADNFAEILASVWEAIPSHLIRNPDFTLKVDTAVWKIMQTANVKLQEAFAGILGASMADAVYLTSKIIPFDGMKSNHILGSMSNNLHNGFWVDIENESVRIDRVANNSHTWFMRMDMKMDVNYASSVETVLYEPEAS